LFLTLFDLGKSAGKKVDGAKKPVEDKKAEATKKGPVTKKAETGKKVPETATKKPVKSAANVSAKKVAVSLKKGNGRKATRIHTKVHFYKPNTLKLERNPKVLVKSVKHLPKMGEYRVIKFPLTTESAMKKIEDNNTLVFIVDIKANKRQIKDAVKKLYEIQALKVNTLVR